MMQSAQHPPKVGSFTPIVAPWTTYAASSSPSTASSWKGSYNEDSYHFDGEIVSYDDTEKGMGQVLDRVAILEEEGHVYYVIRGELGEFIPPQDKGSISF